jgi:hypothetical protein
MYITFEPKGNGYRPLKVYIATNVNNVGNEEYYNKGGN